MTTPAILLTLAALAVAALAVVPAAPSALAYERQPALERVVAQLAGVPAEVRCPSSEEWVADPIWGSGSDVSRGWAYTNMVKDYVVLHPLLCAAAARATDGDVPAAERAAGVLVLVHEAYHARRWQSRWSEAKVECQAIRTFKRGARCSARPPRSRTSCCRMRSRSICVWGRG